MPLDPKSRRITGTEKAEIKRVADYLTELEEGLYEWDYPGLTTLGHLTELHHVIETPMDATAKTEDQQLKVLLACMEYNARRCKEFSRTGQGQSSMLDVDCYIQNAI